MSSWLIMDPLWTPLSVKLNASTFITKNYNFWFSSYWEIGNNIFCHCCFLSRLYILYRKPQSHVNMVCWIIPTLTLLFEKFNADTFTTKNCFIWSCSSSLHKVSKRCKGKEFVVWRWDFAFSHLCPSTYYFYLLLLFT